MKRFIVMIALATQLLACNQVAGYFKNERSDSAKANMEFNPFATVERDRNITAENAYSDLFLDSTVIENYIKTNKVSDSSAQMIRSFYNSRNNQFAWFNSNGLTEQALGFWNLHQYTDNKEAINQSVRQRIDSLIEYDSLMSSTIDSSANTDSSYANTEVALTHQFVQYAMSNKAQGRPDALTLFRFIPVRKMEVLALADSILKKQEDSTAVNRSYSLLKEQLRRHYDVAQKGGWQPIAATTAKIGKGGSSPVIKEIKKRLQLTDNYPAADTTQVYSDSLFTAVKSAQKRFGLDTTGMISDSLINSLNVPVTERIEQIVINMNRMAWMPMPQNTRFIEVNIPDFVLTAYDNSTKAFDMPVIVGKEGTNTVMFSGDLNQIVFSPYWNIPQSIVQKEIMPAIKKDPNYLKSRNMEIVKQGDSIPQIRQLPGQDNAMGKVKFLFPNSYDIYLHDTPKKELFANDNRAISNGCIRLADAEKLATFLLQNKNQWTTEKIRAAMNSGKEQYVKLDNSVPVMITYFTTWVDAEGNLNFRDDIYRHDEEIRNRMFTNASVIGTEPIADSLTKSKKDSTTTRL